MLWPWTGWGWRSFGIPAAGAFLLLAATLACSRGWRSYALGELDRLERLDAAGSRRALMAIAGLFFVWLANIKLCQHFTFQTHFGDLGQDANVCWNTLHGRPFFDSVYKRNFLGDHFEPALALCSLGYIAWNNAAALLLIQSLALAAAVFPLFALSRAVLRNQGLAFAVVALFIVNMYLHTVSSYQFHPETLFIPAAFLALYLLEIRRPWSALAVALLCLGIKEDVPLALAGFGVYLGLGGAGERPPLVPRRYGWLMAVACLAVFFALVLRIIPGFAGSDISVHWGRYADFGRTTNDIVANALSHPVALAGRLLRAGVIRTIIGLLATAGFLPLLSPWALIPILSACVHHLVSDYRPQYILGSQYSCQTIPFLFYAAIRGLKTLTERDRLNKQWAPPALVFLCSMNLLCFPQYVKSFQWKHVAALSRLIHAIPAQAPVGGETEEGYFAHLTLRRDLSAFTEGPPDAAGWPGNVGLVIRPDLIYYSSQRPTMQLPRTEYVLFDSARYARYARFLAGSGKYARIGGGGGFELWRAKK